MLDRSVIGSIKFTDIPGTDKSRVDLNMPIQIVSTSAGLKIIVPLLGNLITMAKDYKDIRAALSEATTAFFHFANEAGNGIMEELSALGWKGTRSTIRFKLSDRERRPEFNDILKVSHKKKFSVNVNV